MNRTIKLLSFVSVSLLFAFGRYPISWLLSSKRRASNIKKMSGGFYTYISSSTGNVLHVRVSGNPKAQPLVLIHGANSSMLQWYYQQLGLEDRYRLVMIDLPGHGLSAKAVDLSVNALAEDLHNVITELSLGNVVLWGHSLGGMIVMEYCVQRFQPLPKAIMIQHCTYSNPLKTIVFSRLMKRIQQPVIVPFFNLVKKYPKVFRVLGYACYLNGLSLLFYRYLLFTGTQTAKELRFTSLLAANTPAESVAEAILQTFKFERENSLASIDVPCLIISGAADRITKPIAGVNLQHRIVGSQLYQVAQGHFSMVENSKQINTAVNDFLTSMDSTILLR